MNLIIFFFSDQVMSRLASREPRRVGYFYFSQRSFFIRVGLKRHQRFSTRQGCETVFFYVNSEKPACFDTLRECSSVRLIQVSLQLLINQKVSSLSRTNKTQMVTIIFDSKPTSVLCHMGDFGCGDGGWTPVMKMDGNKVRSSLCQALR